MIGPHNAIFELPNANKNLTTGENTTYFIPFGPMVNTGSDHSARNQHGHQIDFSPRKCSALFKRLFCFRFVTMCYAVVLRQRREGATSVGLSPRKEELRLFRLQRRWRESEQLVIPSRNSKHASFSLTRSDCVNSCVGKSGD